MTPPIADIFNNHTLSALVFVGAAFLLWAAIAIISSIRHARRFRTRNQLPPDITHPPRRNGK